MMQTSLRRNGFGPLLSRLVLSSSSSSAAAAAVTMTTTTTTTTQAASSFSLPVTTTAATSLQQQCRRSHYTYSSPGQYSHSHEDNNDGHNHNHSHNHDDKLASIWKDRDFTRRGFTVGIGGPVGSGKTALVLQLCLTLTTTNTMSDTTYNHSIMFVPQLAVVTNDIFTQEDGEFLVRKNALPAHKIRAVETGGCPHAAIREDVSANLAALEDLTKVLASESDNESDNDSSSNRRKQVRPLLLCESGGDNLAANFSPELADLTLYVIDVAGGDKVPRKGGPGITQSDLLIVNKTDLAEAVGADLNVMRTDADRMRRGNPNANANANANHGQSGLSSAAVSGPTVFAAVKHGTGMEEIRDFIMSHYQRAMEMAEESNNHKHTK